MQITKNQDTMKNGFSTILRHKLQWLVLLAALLGVSHYVWGGTFTLRGSFNSWSNSAWIDDDIYVFLDKNTTYTFQLYGWNKYFKIKGTTHITGDVSDWWLHKDASNNVSIDTDSNVDGYYKFIRSGSSYWDDSWEYMKLSVKYPGGFKIKYPWYGESGWKWSADMTSTRNGNLFRCEGLYNGTSVNLGSKDDVKYDKTATTIGSPSNGDNCIFIIDAKGVGKTPADATVTIAKKVYSIIGYAADNTNFTTWYSMTSSGSYYYFDCNTNGTFKFSDCATYDPYFYKQFSNKTDSNVGASITNSCSSDDNCTLSTPNSGYTYPIRVWIDPTNKKIWAVATASCTKPTTVTPTYDSTSGSKTVTLGSAKSNALPETTAKTLAPGASGGSSYSYYNWGSTRSTYTTLSSSSAENPTIKFKQEGKFTVTSKVGCSSSDYKSGTVVVNVLPNQLFIVGPLVNSTANPSTWDNGEDLTRTKTSNTNITYTRTWVTPWASTATGNKDFGIRSVKAYGGVAGSMVGSYAYNSAQAGVSVNGSTGNITPSISYAAGDHLSITVTYKGWNSSQSKPEYTYELTSCTPPTPTTTNTPAAVSYTSATLTGTYPTTSGYCSISEKGICYGADTNPTDKHVDSSSSSGSISMDITGLTPGETYHYRAYVVVDGETYYGADKSFATTACTAPVVSSVQMAAASYCRNTGTATALQISATGGVPSYSYQWYINTTQSNTGGDALTTTDDINRGSQTATFTPSIATAGWQKYYYCVVTSGAPCASSSNPSAVSGKIHTYGTSQAGAITGSGTVCKDAEVSLGLDGERADAYQWHAGSISNFTPTNETKIVGATGSTYSAPTSTANQTTYYKVEVTHGPCPSATSATAAEVTVRPNMSVDGVTLNLSSDAICNGVTGTTASIEGTPVTTAAGGVGQYKSSNTSIATVNATTGAITTISAGNTDITYKVTGGCGSDVETTAATLTVKAVPTITPSTSTVTSYVPVSISSNANVTWSRTPDNTNSYLYETTSTAAKFKGNNTSSPYSVRGVAENGCEGSTTITVTQDTETCTQ